MRFLHFGDLHLDKLDALIPDVNTKICRSIERVFDYAVENGIKHVFQGGDVGDKPRLGYESHAALLQTLSKDRYKGLTIHFNLGNHDFAENGVHTLQLLEIVSQWLGANIRVYTQPTEFEIKGVPFRVLPHPFTSTKKGFINMGHFEVKGSTADSGREFGEGIENKHVCFMGHLHTQHTVRNTHYVGTLYQTNFGESLPKYFQCVTATGAKPSEIEVDNIKVRTPWKLLNVTVNSLSDLNALTTEDDVYYKLFLKDGLDIDLNQILVAHPNVVRHNTFKTRKELEVLTHRDFDFDADVVEWASDLDERQVVGDILRSLGLKKSERELAFLVLDRVISSVSRPDGK